MRIPRAFAGTAKSGARCELQGDGFHHLVRVLRRAPGDPLIILDGRGGEFHAVVESVDPARGILAIQVGKPLARTSPGIAPLAVACGLPRGDGFEVAIRWASEMGLARIVPILTRRCTVRIPLGEGAAGKIERWRRIARESAEQCRRSVPLAVDAPCDFNALLARSALFEARWIAVPGGLDFEASGLLEALGAGGGELLVVVGPEGGFDPEEIAAAQKSGLRPLGFPTPVLRTPTAVAYLAALASMAPWV